MRTVVLVGETKGFWGSARCAEGGVTAMEEAAFPPIGVGAPGLPTSPRARQPGRA